MIDNTNPTKTVDNDDHSLFDVIVVGGGLAGLCSAIHLSKNQFRVQVIEKNGYPRHKVCGEYISNEVIPYLHFLGFRPIEENAKDITKFELSSPKSKKIGSPLPLGGFGISRYVIDKSLADLASQSGVSFEHDKVDEVNFNNDIFQISTKNNKTFRSRIVIGAFGKRSSLDQKLKRKFITKKSPYLAVKIHAKGDFPDNLVALHNFKGGYCGVSKVENDHLNICYIASYSEFKKYKNIQDFQEKVVFQNKYLSEIFSQSVSVFEKPLTISQISFSTKSPVEKHMIMCGDSAGMIHPLCGNGMGMAIRSAQIASLLIIKYLNKEISREALEKSYIYTWNKAFKQRLRFGHLAAFLFRHTAIIEFCMPLLKQFPGILPKIIQLSHGKPMEIS